MRSHVKLGKAYRILAVTDTEQSCYIGRILTVHTIGDSANLPPAAVNVSGPVAGFPGSVDFSAGVVIELAKPGKCRCEMFPYPHQTGPRCVARED